MHGNPDDPRIDHAYYRARECFGTAAALFDPPIEPVEIPYENTVLHGYFYRGAGSGPGTDQDATPRPTIIMHSGFDGTCEELHWIGAAAAQERGYHVLTFDGPGQPAARRFDGLVFRPDWENVVTPVLDWLLARPGAPFTDPTRVALFGLSMGGLLAPRAAAFEHRLAAVSYTHLQAPANTWKFAPRLRQASNRTSTRWNRYTRRQTSNEKSLPCRRAQ